MEEATPLAQRAAVFFEALDQLRRFLFAFADGAGPEQRLVLLNRPLDAAAGADHRAVVALAHAHPDLREAELGRLADQEHRHAAGERNRPLPAAGHEVLVLEAEVVADRLENVLRLDRR